MKKSTIALIIAAVVCLGLSAFSAKASVTRTNEAIEEIGEVTYSEDCKAKIDRAVEYYNALDKNLDLQEKVNKEDMKNFDAAKIEYARLAIKAASVADARKVPEGYTSDDIKKFVTEAREVVDSYLSADQTSMVPNYADLTELEKEYTSTGGSGGSDEEVPFRCARKTERRFNDERKMISAVLAAVMTVGMITGCGSSQTTTENKADKADKLESQTDLSFYRL